MADRTEDTPIDHQAKDSSQASGRDEAAKSDKIPACQSCRKKKSKCSREYPCSQCVKSGNKLKGGIKTGYIERLNRRMDAIEEMFVGQSILFQELLQAESISRQDCDDKAPRSSVDKKRKRASDDGFVAVERPQQAVDNADSIDMSEVIPPPEQLNSILDDFFKYFHPWLPMFHVETFRRKVGDPNRTTGTSLLVQAIVAVASHFRSNDGKLSEEQHKKLQQYASECRQRVISSSTESNSKESTQALLLLAFGSIKRGNSASPWSLVAVVTHRVLDLNLHVEEFSIGKHVSGDSSKVLPVEEEAHTWIEVEEHRRISNPTIPSKSVRRRLPYGSSSWEQGRDVKALFFMIDEEPSETEAGSLFFTEHHGTERPNGIDGFGFMIEASELLFQVTKFHMQNTVELDNPSGLSFWLSKLRWLDSRLLQWELRVAKRWRGDTSNGDTDPNLTLAHLTYNAAILALHRTLAYPPDFTQSWLTERISAESRETCMMAANKIATIAKCYLDTNNGIPPHQFVLCLYIAGHFYANHNHTAYRSIQLAQLKSIISVLNEISRRSSWNGNEANNSKCDSPAARFTHTLSASFLTMAGGKQVQNPACQRA
ncbi:transcription factor [Pochonia chlamydosporia 170]|uniref:Transcription factor n=1 Tax=Pochonia chlamydosporia 170 TaxID=1380566 RepID=A0A179EYS7_METCM|nr:transcription factor [Pochonia chlamydosporia 170]OAQ58312.1 transcription factor [Pochonia chlamydosporia 170]